MKEKSVSPQVLPHLISLFWSNRNNPIPFDDYVNVIFSKNCQSYCISLINEFGFNNIESIWVKYKSEIIQNRNFKNWNFIDEVFEDYESVKNKYNLINLSFDLENNETIFIDTMKSLYSFNSKQQSSYLFLKYEIKNDYITFYTNISKQNKFLHTYKIEIRKKDI